MSASPAFVALLLAIAVAIGLWSARHGRARALRAGMLVIAGAALYLALFPPVTREPFAAGELVVLTADATAGQIDALSAGATVVALPEAPARSGSERAPDLATAMRRHPESRHLRVVGSGLPARDRDAARGLVGAFDAAPPARGLVELDAPAAVRSGNAWQVDGRVEGVPDGRVELRDPGGGVVASSSLDGDGRFDFAAQAKSEGSALFGVRVLDRAGVRVEEVALPLVVRAGSPLKLLLLAGAPDAELKYLRRWAIDAGIELDSRIALSEGIAFNEGTAKIDADALREVDLAIVDDRSWNKLRPGERAALRAAAEGGMGLLLRAGATVDAATLASWNEFGFALHAADAVPVDLRKTLRLDASTPSFARQPVGTDAGASASLLRGDDGSDLGVWRADARGRIGAWWLADSFRLALGGANAQFGSLWSDVVYTLARARGSAPPVLAREARVDERISICGLNAQASVETPLQARVGVLVDAATTPSCAAFWPTEPGWHALVAGDRRYPFYVRATDEAPALQRAERQRATRALQGVVADVSSAGRRELPLPRWPFFLVWLTAVGMLWWFERRPARE